MDLQPLKIDRERRRRPGRRSRWVGRLVVLAVLAAVFLVFRRPLLALVDRVRLPEVRVLTVSAASPVAAGALQGTAANGYVVARVRAALSADTPGRIVEMNVTEGQVVEAGYVVARLYSDEYRALHERAEADLGLARAAVESARVAREVASANLSEAKTRTHAAEADLAEAQAALDLADIELRRAEDLVRDRVVSQSELDGARAERDRARARVASLTAGLEATGEAARSAELGLALSGARLAEAEALVAVKSAERDQARATLEKTEVRAPFDGIVVLKDAEVGEVVSPNAVGAQSRGSVATMVDLASLEVQVEVPETSLASVEVGAEARIFLDAYPTKGYTGEVLRIWPTANRQKATVEVRVGFDQPDARLRPEMGARVVFTPPGAADVAEAEDGEPAEPVVLLPRSAIVTIDGVPHVFVLERDVVHARAIRLGGERAGRVVVQDGLASGERVVDSPPDSLRDGERVRVTS